MKIRGQYAILSSYFVVCCYNYLLNTCFDHILSLYKIHSFKSVIN